MVGNYFYTLVCDNHNFDRLEDWSLDSWVEGGGSTAFKFSARNMTFSYHRRIVRHLALVTAFALLCPKLHCFRVSNKQISLKREKNPCRSK